jgi:hypothetical protein
MTTGNFWLDWAVLILQLAIPIWGIGALIVNFEGIVLFVLHYQGAAVGGMLLMEAILAASIVALIIAPELAATKAAAVVLAIHNIIIIVGCIVACVMGGIVFLIVYIIAAALSSIGSALGGATIYTLGRWDDPCECSGEPGCRCDA